jgi:hypothetical protein
MQATCHRCGGDLAEGTGESPFCPHCGAPQLFLALENQSVETGGEAGGAATTGVAAPPKGQPVEWKTAIRCAMAVAGVGSVLRLAALRVDVLSPVCVLWIICASMITMGFYQKRRPGALMDVRIGARIGVVVGLCLAIGLSATVAGWTLALRYGLHSGGFDAQKAEQFAEAQRLAQEWMAAHSMPVAPEMAALERTPEYRAWYELCGVAFGAVGLLVLSTVGGAFAGLLRMRRRPAA